LSLLSIHSCPSLVQGGPDEMVATKLRWNTWQSVEEVVTVRCSLRTLPACMPRSSVGCFQSRLEE